MTIVAKNSDSRIKIILLPDAQILLQYFYEITQVTKD